jgi:hypothetical protein
MTQHFPTYIARAIKIKKETINGPDALSRSRQLAGLSKSDQDKAIPPALNVNTIRTNPLIKTAHFSTVIIIKFYLLKFYGSFKSANDMEPAPHLNKALLQFPGHNYHFQFDFDRSQSLPNLFVGIFAEEL